MEHFLDTTGRKYAKSPIPALLTTVTFLSLHPKLTTYPIPQTLPPTTNRIAPLVLPRPTSIAIFSTAFVVGAFITWDGDVKDGMGVTSAWSLLYLLSKDARRSLAPSRIFDRNRGVKLWGRVGPVALVGLVGVNAVTHGWVYWKGEKKHEAEYRGGKGWVGDV